MTRLGVLLLGALAGALAVWLVIGRSGDGPGAARPHGEPGESTPVEVRRGPEGVTIRLDTATRERIGLQVAQLAGIELPSVVRGFGRLLEQESTQLFEAIGLNFRLWERFSGGGFRCFRPGDHRQNHLRHFSFSFL